jgi:phosphonate transport system substrate-binding protein
MAGMSRRQILAAGAAGVSVALARPRRSMAQPPFRLGLTPVFLDNDAAIVGQLRRALEAQMDRPIELLQKRTYQEVSGLLLEGSADAAWLCGYPYLQHREALSLLAVPVWRGQPLYRSYLIVAQDDPADGLADLRGGTHAFSDPDSNSGYLVTASDIVRMGERPEVFFSRAIFTNGHRNVVRAVASGLVQSGSVDGYVWESLAAVEPRLTDGTRVASRSEWLGFPPFCARSDHISEDALVRFRDALLGLDGTAEGREALRLLLLDGMMQTDPELYSGIEARMRTLMAG